MLDYLTHFTVERNHSESALILVVCKVHLVCTLRTVSFRLSKLTLSSEIKKDCSIFLIFIEQQKRKIWDFYVPNFMTVNS